MNLHNKISSIVLVCVITIFGAGCAKDSMMNNDNMMSDEGSMEKMDDMKGMDTMKDKDMM